MLGEDEISSMAFEMGEIESCSRSQVGLKLKGLVAVMIPRTIFSPRKSDRRIEVPGKIMWPGTDAGNRDPEAERSGFLMRAENVCALTL